MVVTAGPHKGTVPEQLPTPRKSFQQLLREEEARLRILAEERLGLWSDAEETEWRGVLPGGFPLLEEGRSV